jgi:hypothetical protein
MHLLRFLVITLVSKHCLLLELSAAELLLLRAKLLLSV